MLSFNVIVTVRFEFVIWADAHLEKTLEEERSEHLLR